MGQYALVAGWGYKNETVKIPSRFPQDTSIKLSSVDICKEYYIDEFNSRSMMCGGGPKKDSCTGDSGGPLFHQTHSNRFEQIGKLEGRQRILSFLALVL